MQFMQTLFKVSYLLVLHFRIVAVRFPVGLATSEELEDCRRSGGDLRRSATAEGPEPTHCLSVDPFQNP